MTRALFALLLFATPLHAQFEPVLTMHHGYVETLVVNTAPVRTRYDVALLARTAPDTGAIILGRTVTALISPRTFTLAPGERQIVRIRLREVSPTETLGLAILMTPVEAPADSAGGGVRLTLLIRHVAKVLLQ